VSATVTARGITVSFGRRVVLDDVSVVIGPRSRIGVVAPNGTGKTTLLRVIAGLLTPDAGIVRRAPPSATIGYLAQEPERRADETALAFLARRTGVADATTLLHAATAGLAAGAHGADDAYSVALERWLALGGADLDARAEEVGTGLGLPVKVLAQPMATLSGGQAARAALAAIALSRFDVLLLDEPTNDLDFAGLDRLKEFLDGFEGGAMVVSHDRDFLERSITSVLELDEHGGGGVVYNGGWVAYLEAQALRRRHAQAAYEAYSAKRAELVERVRTQRQWAADGVRRVRTDAGEKDKNIKAKRIESSEKVASKVRISEKAIDRLERVDKPWEGWQLQYEIAPAARSGDVVVRLGDAVVHRGSFTLGPIDVEIGWAERVAILGANGSGKTTLLDAILGRLPLDAGSRWMGPGVVVGELEQGRTRFLGRVSLLDSFVAASGLVPGEARSILAKFGLGAGHVGRPASTLSPGERTRAVLALFMARGVNCLVLDEPTNHLDLPAIEQLEQALDTYKGTLLLVTHDRRLLDAVRIDRPIPLLL
jgi:ATPase subunit of ABC transporter with duplicated ATPase domains